jgi:hypothetical protein
MMWAHISSPQAQDRHHFEREQDQQDRPRDRRQPFVAGRPGLIDPVVAPWVELARYGRWSHHHDCARLRPSSRPTNLRRTPASAGYPSPIGAPPAPLTHGA